MPPRAASSAFTSATMRAMAASSAADVILAARALAMLSLLSLSRALCSHLARETEPDRSTHHPGELSGGPHPIYLHLLDGRGLVLIADLKPSRSEYKLALRCELERLTK